MPSQSLATPSAFEPEAIPLERVDAALMSLAVLLTAGPLVFLGYGSDWDSYLVLDRGRALWLEGSWELSRTPGYLLFEGCAGLLDLVGGHLAINVASLAFATAAAIAFLRILRRLDLPHARTLALTLVLMPPFWINASATMDYCWSLALTLWAVLWLWDGRHGLGGIGCGLAIAARFTAALPIACVSIVLLARREGRRSLLRGLLLGVSSGALWYLPPLAAKDWSIGELLSCEGNWDAEYWTAALRFGRFAYKNLMVWGLPATALLAAWLLRSAPLRRLRGLTSERRAAVMASLGIVVLMELLFLRFPLEPAYLLPLLPAALLIFGAGCRGDSRWPAALLLAIALHALVTVNVAKPDTPHEARSAAYGLWLEPGPVLRDALTRRELAHCRTMDCWSDWSGSREAEEAEP